MISNIVSYLEQINRYYSVWQEYADVIISRLRKVELFVSEKMGIDRIEQLNENMTMFVVLFEMAGRSDKTNA